MTSQEAKIIVSRFPTLVDYIIAEGYCDADTPVVDQATYDDVEGKHVFGTVPIFIAAKAARVTEFPVVSSVGIVEATRTDENLRKYVREPRTYIVQTVES